MERLAVQLFGGLTVIYAGAPVEFPSRKAAMLFAYLVNNRGIVHSRGRLADILWGDADETSARRNLSTTLWRVRSALRGVRKLHLHARGEMVSLIGEDDVLDVDAEAFRSLAGVRNTSEDQRLESLVKAEALYKGEFLQGFDFEWCEEDRRHYVALHRDVLASIVDVLFRRGEYGASTSYLQKLLASDPLSEEVNARLMLAYHLTGKRSTALALFDQFRTRLNTELGLEPSPATKELWSKLKRQSDWVIPSLRLEAGLLPSGLHWSEVQLIGRETEMGLLIPTLDDISAHNTTWVITGEGGVGKSRLVAAVGEEAALRGYDVLHGRCPDLETASPYQVFVQALWPRIQRRVAMQGPMAEIIARLMAAASPQALGPVPENGTRVSDSALMSEVLLALLTEAPTGKGTLVILEDLHHIDRASEGLLRTLLDRTASGRFILVATMRSDESSTARILEYLNSAAVVLLLQPLQRLDTERLAAVVLGVQAVPHQLSEVVWTITAGVPLFVLELLKYLADKGYVTVGPNGGTRIDSAAIAATGPALPTRIMEVLRRRIRGLEASQRAILLCAAVLGSEVSYAELEAMVERPLDEISEDVKTLLQRRLVIECDGGLRFPHETARAAVLSTATRGTRRALHLRAAKLLEQTGAPAQALVWHFEEAGDLVHASHYSEISGDTARGLHANADALRWYTISLAHKGRRKNTPDGERGRARLLLKRQAVMDLMGDRRGQARDIREALTIATRLDDPSLEADAEYHHSRLLGRENLNDKALGAATRAIRLYRQLRDPQGEAGASESLGLAHMNLRDQSGARHAFQRALALFRKAGDIGGEARALAHLGTLLVLDGKGTRALQHLERAEQTLRMLDDKRSLAGTVLQEGILVRDFGQLGASESLLRTGISLMREIGDRVGEARGLSQLSHTHVAMGRARDAMHEARRALQVATLANDTRAMIVFLNNAAYGVFRCVGDFLRAERFVWRAIQLARETNRQENLANYYDSMAAVQLDKGDPLEALRWARQSRTAFNSWNGRARFLGPQISLRLGMCYFELGEHNRAVVFLERAISAWEREGEKGLRILALSFVAAAHAHQSRTAQALGCAREVERLLRSVDGVEQLQLVHWNQFRTFERLGFPAAAKRSLRRAYVSLLQQSSGLKGRYRRRFLYGVNRNTRILEEVDRAFGASVGIDEATRQVAVSMHPLAALGTFDNVEERRKAVAQYLAAGMLQRKIALRLGVSERTIRGDVAFLRTAQDSKVNSSVETGLMPMPAAEVIKGVRD